MKIKAKKVEISNRDIILGINKLNAKDRRIIIEGITRMSTVQRQKQAFATAKKLLLDSHLDDADLIILLSECNIMAAKLKKIINNSRYDRNKRQ